MVSTDAATGWYVRGMPISWDPSLSLGVADIDRQHQELFARLDTLLEAMRGGKTVDEVERTLRFLGDYVVTHFRAEEDLMRKRAYPGLEAHAEEHRRFVEDFSNLVREFLNEGVTTLLTIRTNARVTAWLRDHIYRTDKALASFLADPYAVRAVVPRARG
jgi:hemerythrin